MNKQEDIPPRPEDFKDEKGEIDWISFYEAVEYWEIKKNGLR